MKNNKRKTLWILIGIGSAILLLLILISSIINIGERLAKIHIHISYAFYVIILILVGILIIYPVLSILSTPSFKLTEYNEPKKTEKRKNTNYKTLKKIAKNLIENNETIPQNRKEQLQKVLNNKKELQNQLEPILKIYVKNEIDKIINKNAVTVMLTTAISQDNNLDAITIITINIQMIKDIVYISGYRPSNAKLGKLTYRVLKNVLVSYGLNGINISDLVTKFIKSGNNIVSSILGPIIEMGVQGTANAFLTLRIGIQTRNFLFKEYHLANVLDNELEIDEAKARIKQLKKDIDLMKKEDKKTKKEEKSEN